MLPALVGLAVCVHELLVLPRHMAATRQLAEACLADPVDGHVDSLQFPDHPDCFIYNPERHERERSFEGPPTLTASQAALVLAALHDVGCPHVEKVVVIPADAATVIPPSDANSNVYIVSSDFGRAVRWRTIRDRVNALGDYAIGWFTALVSSFEQMLPGLAAARHVTASDYDDDLLMAADRDWKVDFNRLHRWLPVQGYPELASGFFVGQVHALSTDPTLEEESQALRGAITQLYHLYNNPPEGLPAASVTTFSAFLDAAIESARRRQNVVGEMARRRQRDIAVETARQGLGTPADKSTLTSDREASRIASGFAKQANTFTERPPAVKGRRVVALKEPNDKQRRLYLYQFATGKKQADLAGDPAVMIILGRRVGQGTISRYLACAAAWIKAGNIIQDHAPPLTSQPVAVDPKQLELGERRDRRPKRQRPRGNSDQD
jgi:hypothetical protein